MLSLNFIKIWNGLALQACNCLTLITLKVFNMFLSLALWWRFSDTIDKAVDLTLWRIKVTKRFTYKKQARRHDFYVETQFEKTTGRKGRIHYFQDVTVNLIDLYYVYNLFVLSYCLMDVPVYKYPTRFNKSADIMNAYNNRICTLWFLHNRSDYAVDYCEWFTLLTVTVRDRAWVVVTF